MAPGAAHDLGKSAEGRNDRCGGQSGRPDRSTDRSVLTPQRTLIYGSWIGRSVVQLNPAVPLENLLPILVGDAMRFKPHRLIDKGKPLVGDISEWQSSLVTPRGKPTDCATKPPEFRLGPKRIRASNETRRAYTDAFKAADSHDLGPLLAFARS